MAPRARAKSSKAARKQLARRRDQGVPLLPIVVGSILAVLAIAMIGFIIALNRPAGPVAPSVSGIPCDQLEQTQVHYHAALQIIYHGTVTNLRDNTGIQTNSAGNVSCYYWLHVHGGEKNVLHIESPASKTFTLGQFFDVADAWSKANGYDAMKLDATHVATFTLGPEDKMVIYIDKGDGKGATVYTGDPRAIVLQQHEVITIEITPPDVTPPPAFTFPSGT